MKFKVFIAMTIKGTVLWDVRQCSLVDFYTCFAGIFSLHLRGEKRDYAENGGNKLLVKSGTSTRSHGLTFQNTIILYF
jgi:hypothetical protein